MRTTPPDSRDDRSARSPSETDEPPSDDAHESVNTPEAAEPEEEQVESTADLRTRKIFELRNKIASGDYEIDADTIAKRIVDDI